MQGKEKGTQGGTLQDCGDIDPMYSIVLQEHAVWSARQLVNYPSH